MNQHDDGKLEFCRQKAAPAGSSLYYSILYQHPDDKHVLYILHAFHNVLTEVISECSDPGVAHIKFAWWLEELQRLANGQPRHPITRAMAGTEITNEFISRLAQIVEHYDRHIDLEQPVEYRHLIDFLEQGPGQFWELLASVIGYEHPDTLPVISGLGAQFGYFHILQEQPWHIQQQRDYLPLDETRRMTDRVSLYNLQLERLERELVRLAGLLPGIDHARQRHALALARIMAITCRENRRAGGDLLSRRVSLTPLRKLWIAWYCKLLYR